jgi:hypothetical protein
MALGREVRVEALGDAELARLHARGIVPKRGTIPVEEDTDEPVLLALHEAGLAFLSDHRQGWSPADRIEELLERSGRSDRATLCAFDGTNWLVWSSQ